MHSAHEHIEPVHLTVIEPEQWEPCSPAWLERGGNCTTAPRVWNASSNNHYHPRLNALERPAATESIGDATGAQSAEQGTTTMEAIEDRLELVFVSRHGWYEEGFRDLLHSVFLALEELHVSPQALDDALTKSLEAHANSD